VAGALAQLSTAGDSPARARAAPWAAASGTRTGTNSTFSFPAQSSLTCTWNGANVARAAHSSSPARKPGKLRASSMRPTSTARRAAPSTRSTTARYTGAQAATGTTVCPGT
jgi:hypothetical protein